LSARQIPVIDISAAGGTARKIEEACRDIGFMTITGHGIRPEVVVAVRQAVIQYFSLPESMKLADRISRDNYRGYIPTGFFSPAGDAGSADNYEGYKLHFEVADDDPIRADCDLYGPNKWPDLPNFRSSVLCYWRECDRVAQILLGALATVLGISRNDFLEYFEQPLTNMTLLHYPPQASAADGFGIHPHKDTDALTILAPDAVGGLMIRCRGADEWIEARPSRNALIVNIGDLLELWSGGYLVSTPHKVINTSGAERYSFPYFAVPRFDTVVRPLRPPEPGFARSSVHVGDVSREVWRNNWLDEVPQNSQYDLGTLED
jgi:isopenicillin N synthase-like dioxygenase